MPNNIDSSFLFLHPKCNAKQHSVQGSLYSHRCQAAARSGNCRHCQCSADQSSSGHLDRNILSDCVMCQNVTQYVGKPCRKLKMACVATGIKLLEKECADLEHTAHPALDKLTVRVRLPADCA